MPSQTTYYDLWLYNASSDQAESFLDYRSDIAGTSALSNMNKIDDALNDNAVNIAALQTKKNVLNVPANFISGNDYEATVSGYESYSTDDVIDVVLDTDSTGTVTLNINSLGIKSLMKINSSGTPVNLDNTNLLASRHYMFSYDGTRWIWVNATSADQIDIGGASGNFVSIASDGSMEDSTKSASDFLAAALFDANTILAADSDDTPAALVVAEQTIVGRKTGGNIDALTKTEALTLLNVEDGSDVTDATNVDAAGAVMNADFDANTVLAATSDDTPIALTVVEETLVGRKTGGNIDALTKTESLTILNVEDGADVTDATNVNGAGATMNADTDLTGNGYFIDEDDLSSDSDIKVPSQQSVKAYVDTGVVTMENKRVTPRVTTEASSTTPTINTDNVDAHSITALATAITSMTTNLSGTPTNVQKLLIRILDDGTARAITWGASFQAMGVALPATTTISKVLTVGFIYDTVDSKWGCVASAEEA